MGPRTPWGRGPHGVATSWALPQLAALQIDIHLLDNRYAAPPVVFIDELSVSSLMARYSLSSSCPAVWGDGEAGLCLGWQPCG
jgi:hypothetical protein